MDFLRCCRRGRRGLGLVLLICAGTNVADASGWNGAGVGHWGGRGFGGGAFNGPRLAPLSPIGPGPLFAAPPLHPHYGYGVPRLVFRAPHAYPAYPYGYSAQPGYPLVQEIYAPPPPAPQLAVSSGPKSVSPPGPSSATAEGPSKPFSCGGDHALKLNGNDAGPARGAGCISP